jgi:hypothetical protein
MSALATRSWLTGGALLALLAGAVVLLWSGGGWSGSGTGAEDTGKSAGPRRQKTLAKDVLMQTEGKKRRVIVSAYVCKREYLQIEQLLCRTGTKEHEAILATDADASKIHVALLAAGATPGSPVKYEPQYQPARGTVIKVTLQYEANGKLTTVPAQQWIRNRETRKHLAVDWVFAGSLLKPDPEGANKPPYYLANGGDVICTCNMETAMLDLPIRNTKEFFARAWEPDTDRIPPEDTPVSVILEPVLEPK